MLTLVRVSDRDYGVRSVVLWNRNNVLPLFPVSVRNPRTAVTLVDAVEFLVGGVWHIKTLGLVIKSTDA